MSSTSRMAVAIISYNTLHHLRRCLDRIRLLDAREVVVADNGSTDGSIEMVRDEFPEVRLVVDRRNLGYGVAGNQAIAACEAPYVLLLNSDTVLAPGALERLAGHLDANPRVGIVGPRLHNPDGTLQNSARHWPRPVTARPLLKLLPPAVRERSILMWPHDRPRVVDWVVGAAMAIRRTAFDALGGFDPRFFMYFEETDLCRRMHAAGWETLFVPDAVVIHHGGASTIQWRSAMALQYLASMRLFYRLHYPPQDLRRLDALLAVSAATRLVRLRARLLVTDDPAVATALLGDIGVCHRVLRGNWPAPPHRSHGDGGEPRGRGGGDGGDLLPRASWGGGGDVGARG